MKNAISIYCDEQLLAWVDSLPGRSRNEKIVELLQEVREHQAPSENSSSTEGVFTLHQDGTTLVCSLHPESKKSLAKIFTPFDVTLESACGCVFRKPQLKGRWQRLSIGNGEGTCLFDDPNTIVFTLKQLETVKDALCREESALVILSEKYQMRGVNEYAQHFKTKSEQAGALKLDLKVGQGLRKGSTQMNLITEALFAAELQVRKDDLLKAKSFFDLRTELENAQAS